MIPKKCKRLAEVDFPIAAVSKHAAREKSIRHGHPSTLHLWWARRPLAACRAMLLGLLLPDPCDKDCPDDFKEQARQLLPRVQGMAGPKDEDLRAALLKFIGDFANWDLSADRIYLEVGRRLIKAAHDEETPLVVDSFAGGGSIPLEALRLGCETFAADLNPLACLILKLMLEDIPRYGPELAEEFRRVGIQVKEDAEKQLAEFYPGNPNGAKPIAYLWARTVRCEAPDCGAEIPIFKTAWLSKKGAKRARYFKESANGDCIALLMESTPKGGPIAFRITRGHGSETPRPGFAPLRATKASGNNSNAVCPCCSTVLKGDRVMAQLAAQHTGCEALFDNDGTRMGGAYLLAVIEGRLQASGKIFRLPTSRDYEGAWKAAQKAKSVTECNPTAQLNPVRPSPNARGLTAPTRYGAQTFADLFTARQRLAIVTLAKVIENRIVTQGTLDSVSLAVLLALGRCVDQTSAHVRWIPSMEAVASSFPRQALQMVWDFVESVPIGDQSANYGVAIEWIRKVTDRQGRSDVKTGQVQQADARQLSLPDESADVYFTDPPYYDAVPYADLSDFFLVWLKTALPPSAANFMHLDEGDGLSPKTEECVWNQAHEVDGKPKDPAFFEASVGTAFAEGCRALKNDGIACVVFAHKTTEGWEALLNGLFKAGWVIQASWPIVTERGVRTNAQNTASLASSIHLVCRRRPEDAPIGDWAEVLRELPWRVGNWMERLQAEGIRGADLVFACIGPALEIFSRCSKVETAEGRDVGLPEFLEKVWEVVGRTALEQVLGTAEAGGGNGSAGAMEEDARLTALFLWTIQSTNIEAMNGEEEAVDEGVSDEEDAEDEASRGKQKGFSLIFDVVRRFAQPLGIHLPDWEGRIIETKKGVVRLLAVAERARQLFGEDGAEAVANQLEQHSGGVVQLALFTEGAAGATRVLGGRGRRKKRSTDVTDEALNVQREVTTLDRVHAAMLLQSSGRANALRALLKAEQDRSPDFLRLANALSALYPKGSEEKRLLDAMLLAMPRA